MELHAYSPLTPSWQLVSLRPAGQHGPMRRAATRAGAALLTVSPWTLQYRDDAHTRQQLQLALAAERVIFTSPAAVRAAARLVPLSAPLPGQLLAVGEGSARLLRRHGAGAVLAPGRMDSEGLLALIPQDLRGTRVGLVTAPGGRGMIASQVQQRGARLVRADIYQRHARALSPQELRKLHDSLSLPLVVALSSAEAMQLIWPQLPAAVQAYWLQQPLVAASDRLVQLAAIYGFHRVHRAAGPLPSQLAAAARSAIAAVG